MEPKTKHTPTPWKVNEGACNIKDANGYSRAEAWQWNDAAFIVRAVNAHEELLNTLRHLRAELEYQNLDVNDVLKGLWNAADEAITKAEGK